MSQSTTDTTGDQVGLLFAGLSFAQNHCTPLEVNILSKQRLVIIGNGMAGMKTVEEVLSNNPDQFTITVFGSEPYGNYNRIMLSPVLCGEKRIEDIMINDERWYRDHKITLHAGRNKTIVRLDLLNNRVFASDETVADYDRLLIATGSTPFILPIPGYNLDGVIAFREILDVEKMILYSKTHQHAVVLGGGLLGLEAANGLAQQGMQVTVVHNREHLLNRQIDRHAAQLLQNELEQRGIRFKMAAQAQQLLDDGQGHVKAARIDDETVPCDLFVMAIGIRPNISLAQRSGLQCDRGILVNDTLQTYDPAVYAVGECIQHRDKTFGLVAPLFEQAKVCANHLSEHGMAEYRSLPVPTKLKVTGIKLFSMGDFRAEDTNSETLIFKDAEKKVYKKLVLKNNKLIGAVLYGDTNQGIWYQQLLEHEIDITPIRPLLIFGEAYANAFIEQQNATNSDKSTLPSNQKVA